LKKKNNKHKIKNINKSKENRENIDMNLKIGRNLNSKCKNIRKKNKNNEYIKVKLRAESQVNVNKDDQQSKVS